MTSPLPSSNSWNGRFIGDNQRYRLDKRLAGGGMGEVFLAMDTRVGQQVALKLLKDTLVASAEMRKRFEREIAVCAALQSDHIVKISDCGVTIEGYPFYVMEYLRGQTLRQSLLREKRLSVTRTVSIIAQVCKGLQLAHAGVNLQRDGGKTTEHIKVIHRDLKPDNIFLVPTDLGEWVKILDFGVAKIRNESSEQTNITNTFIGTFRYAAPEQLQSDKNLDSRADIYSLGLILYEMLGGGDPFGLSVKANNISEASWVLAHAYEPPKPLRSQPGCEHLSVEIEAIVLKCLQKNPQNRFATVEELDQALQAAAKYVEYDEAIALHPTVPKPANNSETIPRPLTPEQIQLQDTIPPAYDGETILRPLKPEAENFGQDETILRLKPLYHQDIDPETIPRSLIEIEPSRGEDETVPRAQPLENQSSQPETINRPLTPMGDSQAEGTIFQPRPGQNSSSEPETINRPLQPFAQNPGQEDSIPRPQPLPNQDSQPETINRPLQAFAQNQPEGTILQPRPTPYPNRHPNSAGASPVNQPEVSPPEGTILQPRPVPQPVTEGTIYQSRPVPQPVTEGTIYQSRSTQTLPEQTIFQPRKNQQTPEKLPSNFWRIVGVLLVIGLALGAFLYFNPQLPSGKDKNQKTWQNFNHVW